MKAHTTAFKEQIKEMGRELDSIITYGDTVLGNEQLNAVTPSFQSSILKSAMKQLDIDSNVYIPVGSVLRYEFGVKVNGEYEYINFGNYIVKDIEKQEDTNSYKITCYDKMLLSMKDYAKMPITYPITIRNYINSLCAFLGLSFANTNDTFVNYNKTIPTELYLDSEGNSLGYTFRDVFDELAQVTASTICINNNDEVEIRYIKDAINSSVKKGTKIETNDSMDYPVLNYKQNGYTKQNVYSGKNKNVRAEEVKSGDSSPANAFTNLSEYDGYKNVVEVSTNIAYMTLQTNGMSDDFYKKVASGGIDITTMLLIKKTNANTTIKFYLGSITGGNSYKELIHYKDEANGWAWYYTTHTIPVSPANTTIANHVSSPSTNFATFYIAKIQTLIGSTPSDFEPYVGGKASPNPDYPQEIEVATGSVSVKSTGKNLALMTSKSNNNYYATLENGILTINGTSTSLGNVNFNINNASDLVLKANKTYTISLICSGKVSGATYKSVYLKLGDLPSILMGSLSNDKTISYTYTPEEDIVAKLVNIDLGANNTFDNYVIKFQIEENEQATDYEPYKGESSIAYDLGDNFLADKDYIENGVLNKNIRHLRLAIADMNDSETYPGWYNVPYLLADYPGYNTPTFPTNNIISNIGEKWGFGINTNGSNSTLFLNKSYFGKTATEWKTNYPDLVVDIYYEMPTPEQIQLETTGELRTFEPNTIITNDLDSEMEVEYGNSFDTIDKEYFKDINVNFGEKYGPINSVVLSRASESDNIYSRDEESVEKNGLCELKIKENQIMNFNNRDEFLQNIFEKLNGTEYHLNDFASTGITYYDICDRYKVNIDDKIYSCVMFNDEILITQGLQENVFTEMPEETQTDYTKADKTDRKINQTYIIVDKQNQQIESVISQTDAQNQKISQVTQTVEELNSKISDVADITISAEDNDAQVELDNINQSEPIRIVIRPIGESISYLYPHENLYPNDTLYLKNRKIRFTNTKTEEIFDYELPTDLLYYDGENYDEFILDYDAQSCVVNKRVGYNANGTTYVLDTPTTLEFEYPRILLTDGDYQINILGYNTAYLFVRLMAQNIYTTQFATRAEMNNTITQSITDSENTIKSEVSNTYTTKRETTTLSNNINQRITNEVNEINLEVNKKANTTDVNASLNLKVSKDDNNQIVSMLNASANVINLNSNRLIVNSDNFKLTKEGNMTCSNANITGGNLSLGSSTSSLPKITVSGTGFAGYNNSCKMYADGIRIFNSNNSELAQIATGTFISGGTRYQSVGFSSSAGGYDIYVSPTGIELTGSGGGTYITSSEVETPKLTQTSLKESKKNFEKFDGALNIINDIDLYKYNLKVEEDNAKKHIGFVIGNGYKYSKEITAVDEEGKEIGVDLYSMTSLCLQAIKEQQEIINQLKEEISKLKESEK